MRSECGYQGHVCGLNRVQFISRYRDENDYCVNGTRVSLTDSGEFNGTPEQAEAVRLFELHRYAEYLVWRNDFRLRVGGEIGEIQPFSCNITF
jgi:hypothetical protein